MRLEEWVDQHDDRMAVRARIAEAFGLTEVAVRHWCNGTRRVPPERCLEIEALTEGLVTAQEMRPDVFGTQAEAARPRPSEAA